MNARPVFPFIINEKELVFYDAMNGKVYKQGELEEVEDTEGLQEFVSMFKQESSFEVPLEQMNHTMEARKLLERKLKKHGNIKN